MRNHRAPVFMLIATLVISLLGVGLPTSAQDAPFTPVDGDSLTEIVVEGQRYSRDLDVPLDMTQMEPLTAESGETVYQEPGESDPFNALYLPLDDGSGLATRYFPQFVGDAAAVCPADATDAATLTGETGTYITGGSEPDLTQDSPQLTAVGSTGDGFAILALTGDDSLANLFVAQNNGQGPNSLVRYVIVEPSGSPATLGDAFTFAGQAFSLSSPPVVPVDTFVRVGCAGLFPLLAEAPDAPYSLVAVEVAGENAWYVAQVTEEPVATPTEAPATPEPTEAPVIPTEVPATPEPTEAPAVPTEIPATPEPTATPTLPATPEPTLEPTTEPTPSPTEAPAVEPTVPSTPDPTSEPTAAPAEEPTAEPTQDTTGDEPQALPTEAPPTPEPDQPTPTVAPVRPTPTPRPLQPQAIVPTLPADVPSPPAGQSDAIACVGSTGERDANGVPERLPRNLQYGGSSWQYSGQIASGEAGDLAASGCVGAFVLFLPADGTASDQIYLGIQNDAENLFAFERATSFTVQSENQTTQSPRSLELGGTEETSAVRYRATDPWLPSIYSSLSLEVYVADPEAGLPDRLYGYSVGNDAFGEYVRQGDADTAPQEVLDEAETLGVHSELLLEGQRYVLVALWTPFGTTTNGWLTLYSVDGQAEPDRLIGLDPRRTDLPVFNAES